MMFMSVLIASTIDGDGVLTDGAASTLTYSVGGHAITCGTACTLTNDDSCGDATTDSAAATLTYGGGIVVAMTNGAAATLTKDGGCAFTGDVHDPVSGKDLVSLYAIHTNANPKNTTEKVTSPASVSTSHSIWEDSKKIA